MSVLPHLSEVVRAIRARKQLGMVEFSRLLGVSAASISRYEASKIVPSRPVLQHLMVMAEGAEKVALARAIGESLGEFETKENPSIPVEIVLAGDSPVTEKERQWLERALVVLRSSKGPLLEGILSSLHEGALIDELTKRPKPEGQKD